MLELASPSDLVAYCGKILGTSDWKVVEQEAIDLYSRATGDNQWIHVDVERARREMPGGKTIAPGLLVLAWAPAMAGQIYRIRKRSRSLNYGANRVRFIAPVPVGSRVRVQVKLNAAERLKDGGHRFAFEYTIELEGSDKPAAVAELLAQMYD